MKNQMIPSLIFLGLSIMTSVGHAANVSIFNCAVAKVTDDSVFEESLSREYPDVTLTQDSITKALEMIVGGNIPYELKSGDRVQFIKSSAGILAQAQYKGSSRIVEIKVSPENNGKKWGILSVRQDVRSSFSRVALLICR